MCYALNRCLKKNGKTYNITTALEFVTSQSAFLDAMKELKSLGYGYIVNHTEITGAGKYVMHSMFITFVKNCCLIIVKVQPFENREKFQHGVICHNFKAK